MNKALLLIALFSGFVFWQGCTPKSTTSSIPVVDPWDTDRPHDPWVFRSVLDTQARMITLALHDQLWAAYRTNDCALYKVWKGHVNFDGAVYTTVHGPQPISIGDAYFVNTFQSPWQIIEKEQSTEAETCYKGHRFEDGHVILMYELLYKGAVITIEEQAEYLEPESGLPGFERIFTTKNVPADAQIALQTNLSSIALKERVETTGKFIEEVSKPRTKGSITAFDISGRLMLNSNAETRFMVTFGKKPMIENPNKPADEEQEELPLGQRLIARSDCKTCHNAFKKTIGPAYKEVALRYRNTEENIAMLAAKVKTGGSGVWGGQVMNAHPNESQTTLHEMVSYIMSLDAEEEAALTKADTTGQADSLVIVTAETIDDNMLLPGILAKYYTHDKYINKLADVNTRQVAKYEGIIPQIYAMDSDLAWAGDNFAIFFEGYLLIPNDGEYQFSLISDDGSRMYLHNDLLIDHDGLHGADEKQAAAKLEKGYHPFRVNYFQGRGGKNIIWKWKHPDSLAFQKVEKNALFHHASRQAPRSTSSDIAFPQSSEIPGDAMPLTDVHPSYTLSQARPDDFLPKVGGMDFLSDGRMVVSTWDANGSVYLLEGVQSGDPAKIKVKTIAKGLAEPLGLKVVDDQIYVLQKQELTHLIDRNGDDMIDEYKTLSNRWQVSANFHEFAFGLAYKDGHFYAALATAIDPGGASTQPQIPDRGKVVKISKADGNTSFVAHGLRTPNGIGLGVDNEIFVTDNQGDWLPASKVVHVTDGAWFGSRSVDFEGTAELEENLPVVWLPQDEIGNSPSTPLAIDDGPYKGQMIHGEVTNGGVKRVFVEQINGKYQGCVFRFIQGLEAGVNRLCWGPDGALYAGGIGSTGNWRQTDKLWYGLQRLKYNGQATFEMLAVRARSNGMEIEFTDPLQEGDGWAASDYLVKQWRYQPTEEYGGPKLDEEILSIQSVHVSEDRKRVFLELPGIKDKHVIYLRLNNHFVSASGNGLWSTEAWYTLNQLPENLPGFTASRPEIQPNTLTSSEKAKGWQLLFDGQTTKGWRNYGKQSIGSSWKVENGTLLLDAQRKPEGGWQAEDGGDIITEEEFENYELRLEWKIAPCGNSGIIFNVAESEEDDFVWQTGPEMQILDDACHPDARIETHRAADLYDMISTSFPTVKPAGQWNKVRLIVKEGNVEHWLNGYKVVSYKLWTDKWNDMVARSKFKDMPRFGKARKGHIALQDHGDPVWFRNIKIRRLQPAG